MQHRPYNFAPGPATMPESVLTQAARDMLDWNGCGMGVMEMSHRGKEFTSIIEKAERDLRDLLAVRDPLYREIADLVVETDERPPRMVVLDILERLAQLPPR